MQNERDGIGSTLRLKSILKVSILLFGCLASLSAGGAKTYLRQQPAPILGLEVVNASPDNKLDPDGFMLKALKEALLKRLGPHLAGPDTPRDTAKLIVVLTGRSVPPPISPGLSLLSWRAMDPRLAAYSAIGITKAHLKQVPQLGYDPAVFTVTISIVKGNPDGFSVSYPMDPGEIIACMEPLTPGASTQAALPIEEGQAIAKAAVKFLKAKLEWPTKMIQP